MTWKYIWKIFENIIAKVVQSSSLCYIDTKQNKNFMRDNIKHIDLGTLQELAYSFHCFSFTESLKSYLGDDARVVSIKHLVSPSIQGQTYFTKSQLYHLDDQAERMIKLIIPLKPISTKSGPFSFIPAPITMQIKKIISYGLPFKDSNIPIGIEKKYYFSDKSVQFLTCSTPEWLLIDTSRCLHMGSRNVETERSLLMISMNGGVRTTFIAEPISVSLA